MKRAWIRLTAALICVALFGSVACAQDYADSEQIFELKLGDEYTVLDDSNLKSHSDFITRLGSSVENFRKAMTAGGIRMYAATEDNSRQVQVKVWTGDAAERVGDLNALTDDGLQTLRTEIGGTLLSDGDELLESEQLERNEQIFFRFRVRAANYLEGDGNESIGYCFDEYLTIADGNFVALVFYNSGSDFSEAETAESRALFQAFTVHKAAVRDDGERNMSLWVFSMVVLIAAAGVAVFVVSTFVRDLRSRRDKPETIPDRIKMRRK